VVVPSSKYQLVEWPEGSIVPASIAEVPVTAVGGPVTETGLPDVVNVWSAPAVVPVAFVVTIRKWKLAPAARPVTAADMFFVPVPEPAFCTAVFEP